MKNRKIVPAFFQVYENDCLRDYLEHMAQKGWKLSSVGSMFLHFEACKPHRIRYCVEIMEKPSNWWYWKDRPYPPEREETHESAE